MLANALGALSARNGQMAFEEECLLDCFTEAVGGMVNTMWH
jgi:hypothetical protein